MNNEKKYMNPKTFMFVKYILTIACVLFYIAPVMTLFRAFGKINLADSDFLKIQIVLIVLATILCAIYLWLRFSLHNSNGYKYTRTERWLLIGFLFLLCVVVIMSCIVAFINFGATNAASKIIFYVLEPMILIAGVCCSMLEQKSRINEQIYIYQIWEQHQPATTSSEAADDTKKRNDQQEQKKKNKPSVTITEQEIKNTNNPFLETKEDEKYD